MNLFLISFFSLHQAQVQQYKQNKSFQLFYLFIFMGVSCSAAAYMYMYVCAVAFFRKPPRQQIKKWKGITIISATNQVLNDIKIKIIKVYRIVLLVVAHKTIKLHSIHPYISTNLKNKKRIFQFLFAQLDCVNVFSIIVELNL